MYFKKANLFKFMLRFGGVLAGIIVLVLIIVKNNSMVPKHSKTLKEKIEDSGIATSSDKNRLRMMSNQKKQADEMSNLERELSRLSKKIVSLESTVAKLMVNQHTAAGSDLIGNADQDSAEETSEMEEEKIMSQIKAQVDMMEETLQYEPVDAEWSDSVRIALYKSVQENTTGNFEILNADCRSTLCRVDLTFDTALPEDSFRELQDLIPWNGEAFFQVDDTDSGQAVLYIAREGYSLPQLLEQEGNASMSR